uniref:hypothetical protein n=1 Tax=Synechococcus sp. CS-1329 TaxID=2847975 RepID=UPI00223BE5AA|nr:hypothetical protein [Synechococcus sp. CS-1329]
MPAAEAATEPATESLSGSGSEAVAEAGFTPLPTAQQLEAARPPGRLDPFAPLAVTPAASRSESAAATGSGGRAAQPTPPTPALTLPAGFRFQGVISSGGRPRALVQFGDQSGSLVIGDIGGRSTDLLPKAWRVSSIDLQRGRLTLEGRQRQGSSQMVTAEL